MPTREYILIPEGSHETLKLNVSQAKEQILPDSSIPSRLFELLDQRGLHVPCWMCKDGIMIQGSEAQARVVGRLVDELPNLMASSRKDQMLPKAANDDEKIHAAGPFGLAARRVNADSLRPAFFAATVDRQGLNVPYARPAAYELRWAA